MVFDVGIWLFVIFLLLLEIYIGLLSKWFFKTRHTFFSVFSVTGQIYDFYNNTFCITLNILERRFSPASFRCYLVILGVYQIAFYQFERIDNYVLYLVIHCY